MTRYRLTKPLTKLPRRRGLLMMELNHRMTRWYVDQIDRKRQRVHVEGRGWHQVTPVTPSKRPRKTAKVTRPTRTPAPVITMTPKAAAITAVPKAAPEIRFADLSTVEQCELRRIWHELDNFPYTERTWLDRSDEVARPGGCGTGRGARVTRRSTAEEDCPFVEAAGGAPVYHDVQPHPGATRADVQNAIERFVLGEGATSPIALRALAVARRRAGLPDPWNLAPEKLSRQLLPPDAGLQPLPTEDPEQLQRRHTRIAKRRTNAAHRAWHTMRTTGIRPAVAKVKPIRPEVPADIAARRSAAALKAWTTRRSAAQASA